MSYRAKSQLNSIGLIKLLEFSIIELYSFVNDEDPRESKLGELTMGLLGRLRRVQEQVRAVLSVIVLEVGPPIEPVRAGGGR